MELNFLVFPSPACSYKVDDPLLYYIHKHKKTNDEIGIYSIESSILQN